MTDLIVYIMRPYIQNPRVVTSYTWHSTDVRAEWPPFYSAARYMIGLLFSTKMYECPDLSGFLCERSHFSDIWSTQIFFALRFFEAACSLGIQ